MAVDLTYFEADIGPVFGTKVLDVGSEDDWDGREIWWISRLTN